MYQRLRTSLRNLWYLTAILTVVVCVGILYIAVLHLRLGTLETYAQADKQTELACQSAILITTRMEENARLKIFIEKAKELQETAAFLSQVLSGEHHAGPAFQYPLEIVDDE